MLTVGDRGTYISQVSIFRHFMHRRQLSTQKPARFQLFRRPWPWDWYELHGGERVLRGVRQEQSQRCGYGRELVCLHFLPTV